LPEEFKKNLDQISKNSDFFKNKTPMNEQGKVSPFWSKGNLEKELIVGHNDSENQSVSCKSHCGGNAPQSGDT
jgi:hypothetical protein